MEGFALLEHKASKPMQFKDPTESGIEGKKYILLIRHDPAYALMLHACCHKGPT